MADLKSFINTSSDRIKSAMGVPVDRIKTIQGSLLNQIPDGIYLIDEEGIYICEEDNIEILIIEETEA